MSQCPFVRIFCCGFFCGSKIFIQFLLCSRHIQKFSHRRTVPESPAAAGIDVERVEIFTELFHSPFPAFAVVKGVDFFVNCFNIPVHIPVESHSHIHGLPHHDPVIEIIVIFEYGRIGTVRTAYFRNSSCKVFHILCIKLHGFRPLFFHRQEKTSGSDQLFIREKRTSHFVPGAVIVQIFTIGHTIFVIKSVFPASVMIGKHDTAHIRRKTDSGGNRGEVGITPPPYFHSGQFFLYLFCHFIGKDPVSCGFSPDFSFLRRIKSNTFFTFTPFHTVVGTEIDHYFRSAGKFFSPFYPENGIFSNSFDNFLIGSTGLGFISHIVGNFPFSIYKREIFRMFLKKFIHMIFIFHPFWHIHHPAGHHSRITVTADFADDSPFPHFLRNAFTCTVPQTETHIIAYSPIPGIHSDAVGIHTYSRKTAVGEIRIFDPFPFFDSNGGFYCKILPVFSREKPPDPAVFFQDFINPVQNPDRLFSGDPQGVFLCRDLKAFFPHSFIIGQFQINGVFALYRYNADDRFFTAGDLSQKYGKLLCRMLFNV